MFPGWAHLTATVGLERGWSPPTRAQFDDMGEFIPLPDGPTPPAPAIS